MFTTDGAIVGTWTVTCGACDYRWNLVGTWSVYETAAIESRPCPCCGAYTLRSPEPAAVVGRRRGQIDSLNRSERTKVA